MTSNQVRALVASMLTLLGCEVDDRTLKPIEWTLSDAGNDGSDVTASTCGGSASASCSPNAARGGISGGARSGADDVPGACNDLNGNGALDKTESLAKNLNFDSESYDWDPEVGVSVVWNPLDVCGSAMSGSLNVTYQKSGSATTGASGAAVQCVAASPDLTYAISAMFFLRMPESQGGVSIAFFPTANCTGGKLSGEDSDALTEVGVWTLATVTATAPASAASFEVRLTAGRLDWTVTQDPANALVDGVLVVGLP